MNMQGKKAVNTYVKKGLKAGMKKKVEKMEFSASTVAFIS